jgi:integral membrane protein
MKQSVLTRYRALAYTTGVLLILLTIGVIAKYILKVDGAEGFTRVVAIAHGWLYVAYLVLAFDLGTKARWKFGKLAWVLLAGTIPTAAFFVERKVTREIQPLITAAASDAEPVKA